VLHHTGRLSAGSEAPDLRPGIVHRLDKDTSGVIVVAKTAAAHDALASQFHDRKVEKRYIALTKGIPSPMRGQVEGFIRRDPHNRKRFTHHESEGKQACTEYSVLRAFGDHAVVALFPRTGRTHQLRVHMRHLGCPILGDPVYARRSTGFPEATLMLHALSLNLRLPGDRAPRTFVAKLPHRFAEVIGMLAGFPQT
jgi:23S rRNA pseudouridine1911/1915/1917 synthase